MDMHSGRREKKEQQRHSRRRSRRSRRGRRPTHPRPRPLRGRAHRFHRVQSTILQHHVRILPKSANKFWRHGEREQLPRWRIEFRPANDSRVSPRRAFPQFLDGLEKRSRSQKRKRRRRSTSSSMVHHHGRRESDFKNGQKMFARDERDDETSRDGVRARENQTVGTRLVVSLRKSL